MVADHGAEIPGVSEDDQDVIRLEAAVRQGNAQNPADALAAETGGDGGACFGDGDQIDEKNETISTPPGWKARAVMIFLLTGKRARVKPSGK